jgi:hypothetical protein
MSLLDFTLDDGRKVMVGLSHIVMVWPRKDDKRGSILELDDGKKLSVLQTQAEIELLTVPATSSTAMRRATKCKQVEKHIENF